MLFGGRRSLPGVVVDENAGLTLGVVDGLLVRGVGNYGLPDHIRITIGLEAHNRALIDALADFMAT